MKLPESTATTRSGGQQVVECDRSASAGRSARRCRVLVRTSRQRISRGDPLAHLVAAIAAAAARGAGRSSNASRWPRRLRARRGGSPGVRPGIGRVVDLHDGGVRRRSSRPWRIVHMFSAQPQPDDEVRPPISSAARARRSRRRRRATRGCRGTGPRATADVASSAPYRSASARQRGACAPGAAPGHEDRPPGRSRVVRKRGRGRRGPAPAREVAAASRAPAAGRRLGLHVSGRLSSTVRRSWTAPRRPPRSPRPPPLAGRDAQRVRRPPRAASAAWST